MQLQKLRKLDLSNSTDRLRLLILGGVIVIFLLLFMIITKPLDSSPTFCGRACHNHKPWWRPWRQTDHFGSICYECHMDKFARPHQPPQLQMATGPRHDTVMCSDCHVEYFLIRHLVETAGMEIPAPRSPEINTDRFIEPDADSFGATQ